MGVGVKKIKITFLLVIVLFVNSFYTQSNDCPSVESVLCLIHDSLETAIRSCPLGEKLVLTSVFSACKLLHSLRKSAVALSIKNDKISHNIVQRINEHLLHNPALVKFLEDLNKTLEPYEQLSGHEIAIILKNSALLVPIDEVCFFAEIIRIVQGIDALKLSSKKLNALLHEVELDKSKCVLQLWEKKDHLRDWYAYLEYQAPEIAEKIKFTKKICAGKKNHQYHSYCVGDY